MDTVGLLAVAAATYVPLINFERCCAILSTSDTIEVDLMQAQDSSGTGAKVIPGRVLDETGAGVYTISARADEFDLSSPDVSAQFDHVGVVVVSGTVTLLALLGENPLYMPPKDVVTVVLEA